MNKFQSSGAGDPMQKLTSTQAKYLRGIAHGLKPVVFVGQKGLTDALIRSTEEAFDSHEVIKIKFIEYKEKKQKTEIARDLEGRTRSHLAGMIGHMAILYRPHPDKEKRKIVLPD
jgi:RNA-binding protein